MLQGCPTPPALPHQQSRCAPCSQSALLALQLSRPFTSWPAIWACTGLLVACLLASSLRLQAVQLSPDLCLCPLEPVVSLLHLLGALHKSKCRASHTTCALSALVMAASASAGETMTQSACLLRVMPYMTVTAGSP